MNWVIIGSGNAFVSFHHQNHYLQQYNWVNFESKYNFHWRKCIWKCPLQNGTILFRHLCIDWMLSLNAMWHYRTWSTLVQAMAKPLPKPMLTKFFFSTKSLPDPVLTYHQLGQMGDHTWHSIDGNFTGTALNINHSNVLENHTLNVTAGWETKTFGTRPNWVVSYISYTKSTRPGLFSTCPPKFSLALASGRVLVSQPVTVIFPSGKELNALIFAIPIHWHNHYPWPWQIRMDLPTVTEDFTKLH